MNFSDVESACQELAELLEEATGLSIIDVVSVERPALPEDELHFVRLVAWSYVFLIEVGAVPVRYMQSHLRGTRPADHEKVSKLVRLVTNLRTFQAHQLSDKSKSDNEKRTFVSSWMTIHTGQEEWVVRTRELCGRLVEAIFAMRARWEELTASEPPRAEIIASLIESLDRKWPPHLFDRLIELAATDKGITGLDFAAYRAIRLADWQILAACFDSRADAERAIELVIRADLDRTFG